jgi:16S rRNA (cytosine1402-N4)-methyltransferase
MHQNKNQNTHTTHLPVLLDEVLQCLAPIKDETYLDLTAGYGGHASEILGRTGNYKSSVLVDRDSNALDELALKFGKTGIKIRHQDFLSAAQELESNHNKFDLILADLGVSSPHLNEGTRGFAIRESSELDMRMDQTQDLTAYTIVNTYSESKLAQILKDYGEEPKARQIARVIVAARPVKTTDQLAAIAARVWPGHSRVHPATRTFQALRIAVNDELNLIEKALPVWQNLLAPGGRIAIISFHSLEDRLVKQALAESSGDRYDAELRLITKSPITASLNELAFNPRARSAKLRAAVKIKKMKGNTCLSR